MRSGYVSCGKDLGREHPPHTCRRRHGHNTVCSHAPDLSTDRGFNDAWAEYFAAHPEVLASWAHQNDRWPPGYGDQKELLSA
ncbi:hypothetical protein FNV58_01195 (plasmid) [Streptomyces sp. RLB1-9]|uniref:hypothetical protein n=1 Tax=Streptomyces sp. RLB1-9 TaxID=2594454 RepID=UPI0011659113|nr:hypothetical protein [Streptomyces sp. RLB1-9]QDN94977.1 hypothetical protein FNV58_01195 [Streptomyces sp. RLB1-9]